MRARPFRASHQGEQINHALPSAGTSEWLIQLLSAALMDRDVREHERSRTKAPLPQWAERRLPCCLMHLSLSKLLQLPSLCPPSSSSTLILPSSAFQPAWPQSLFPVPPNCDVCLSGKVPITSRNDYYSWPILVVGPSFPSIFLSPAPFIHALQKEWKNIGSDKCLLLGICYWWCTGLLVLACGSRCLSPLGSSHFSLFICLG